jgi:hypothetical protein
MLTPYELMKKGLNTLTPPIELTKKMPTARFKKE